MGMKKNAQQTPIQGGEPQSDQHSLRLQFLHLRCPEKMEICTQVDPVMTQVQDGHLVRCHLFL